MHAWLGINPLNIQETKALVSLYIPAELPEPSLLVNLLLVPNSHIHISSRPTLKEC